MREVQVVLKCDKCRRPFEEKDMTLDIPLTFGLVSTLVDLCHGCVDDVDVWLSDLFEVGHHDHAKKASKKDSGKRKAPADYKCSDCGYKSSERGVNMHITKSHPNVDDVEAVPLPGVRDA